MVADAARQEVANLRKLASGEPVEGQDPDAIAERIEWAISMLQRVDLLPLVD
jgi:hypothetical protein